MSFLLSRFLKNLNIRFILVSFLSLDFRHIQRIQPIDVALGHGLRRSGLESLGTAIFADDSIPFFHDFGNRRLELTSF